MKNSEDHKNDKNRSEIYIENLYNIVNNNESRFVSSINNTNLYVCFFFMIGTVLLSVACMKVDNSLYIGGLLIQVHFI